MDTFVVKFCHLNPHSSDFGDVSALYAPFLHRLTMPSSLFEHRCPVLVVVCVARKLRPYPSYRRRRDRINLGLWLSLYKGGGYNNRYNSAGHLQAFASSSLRVSCRHEQTAWFHGTTYVFSRLNVTSYAPH